MIDGANQHLVRLLDASSRTRLAELGFAWTVVDQNACAALRFRRCAPDAPALVGLVGGASSGKSTIFNSIVGRAVSLCSAHAHETTGAVAAFPGGGDGDAWADPQLLLPDMPRETYGNHAPTTGQPGVMTRFEHDASELGGCVLVDTPDVTSQMSANEGDVTASMLPWFDALIVVVDEERWFDAAVFAETADLAQQLGATLWIVFNRNEAGEPLSTEDCRNLARHAAGQHAADHTISEYQPGFGYRPISSTTRADVVSWLRGLDPAPRQRCLQDHVHTRCAAVIQDNLQRSEQFSSLREKLHERLALLGSSTSLTRDLLTGDERDLLGLGHRYLPLYDLYSGVKRKLKRLKRPFAADDAVQFEKQTTDLASVLRRNLEQRFDGATARLDRLITDSAYVAPLDGLWRPTWETPAFDEHDWARRIRAHIDAWKAERETQSRHGDTTALLLGVPLLLADLLFLGGAGMTLTWTAVSVAGFLGGKGLSSLAQRSPAFAAYQTTVRSYQSLVREALTEQCDRNLAALPRRHLPMNDALLDALMYWSLEEPAR